jgi:integrase
MRKRADGTWEARYTLGRDPGTGKQIQKSVYGKTQAEVRKKLQAITTSIDNGDYTEPSKMTVGQWFDIWLAEYAKDIKPLTFKSYETHIRNHIKPAFAAVKLLGLNTHQIQSFYNKLQADTAEKAGLSAKTIKNLHGVIHRALSQAVEIGYLKYNPSAACKLPRVEKSEIQPLEEDDISAFLNAIKGHQYETLYIVDLFTGMRQGEILGLTWDCVDFRNGTIYICRQLQKVKGEYKFVSLKNDKTRRITPAPSVLEALKEHRRVQLEWRMAAGSAWEDSNLVFTNKQGGHLAHLTVYNNFKRIVKAIGLPETRFHDLRHTYAVAALQSGDNVKTVQENLGHHTASFTLDVYGHVTERMKKDSAERMERFIKGVSNL